MLKKLAAQSVQKQTRDLDKELPNQPAEESTIKSPHCSRRPPRKSRARSPIDRQIDNVRFSRNRSHSVGRSDQSSHLRALRPSQCFLQYSKEIGETLHYSLPPTLVVQSALRRNEDRASSDREIEETLYGEQEAPGPTAVGSLVLSGIKGRRPGRRIDRGGADEATINLRQGGGGVLRPRRLLLRESVLLTAGRQEGQTDGSVPQQPQCLRILDGSCRLTLVHRPPSCSSTVPPRSPSLILLLVLAAASMKS